MMLSFSQWMIIGVLVGTLGLFIWGKWRYDVVAALALFTSAIVGLVPYDQVFSGIGHPAVVTVACVFILSRGLAKSGVAEQIVSWIEPLSQKTGFHIGALIFVAAFLSMFMNNVGILAMLMPVAIQSSIKAKRSPSMVLMPLSFASILGGLVTLIGTPPNIIISGYRQEALGTPYSMFDFSPVGAPIALIGVLFLAGIGWRLIKHRRFTKQSGIGVFEIESYLFEVKVPKDSKFKGKTIRELEDAISDEDVTLVALIRRNRTNPVPSKRDTVSTYDRLLLEGTQQAIDKVVSHGGFVLLQADNSKAALSVPRSKNKLKNKSKDMAMVEAVVSADSPLVDVTPVQARFRSSYHVNLLGISREGKSHRGRLKAIRFRPGDVVLLYGDNDQLEVAVSNLGCFPLASRNVDFGKRKYAIPALLIFGSAIAVSSLGILPIQLSFGLGVIMMLLSGIVPVRELYTSVEWPVLTLLAAMIPIGNAFAHTGATDTIAQGFISIVGDVPIAVILAIVFVVTMTLSDILSNVATVVLMAPIGQAIASALGVSPDPFFMAVAVSASCAFLTPIGHQNNALVMGPGKYRFGEYWRIGLPLELIIVAVAIPLILVVWPL